MKSSKKNHNIFSKLMKNGDTHFFVRFQCKNKSYNNKNFTKLFGCKSIKDCQEELIKVKARCYQGKPLFVNDSDCLDEYWEKWVEEKILEECWNETSIKNIKSRYENMVKPYLGSKKVILITVEDARNLIYNQLKNRAFSTKSNLKSMLSEFWQKYLMENKVVQENIWLKIGKLKNKEKYRTIEHLTSDTPLEVVQKIYKAISKFQPRMKIWEIKEIQASMYMILMTAHRGSEILSLRAEHILLEQNEIIAPPEITKTNEFYHYPIPPEAKPYIEKAVERGGKIFPNMLREPLRKRWKDMIRDLTDIKYLSNKTLTLHDSRRLLFAVMREDCEIDTLITDSCLNHKQQGSLKNYHNDSYKVIEEAFQKYWSAIRGEKITKKLDIESQEILLEKSREVFETKQKLLQAQKEIVRIKEEKVDTTEFSNNDKYDKILNLVSMLEKKLITQEEFFKLKSDVMLD